MLESLIVASYSFKIDGKSMVVIDFASRLLRSSLRIRSLLIVGVSELISSELFEIASEVCWICGRTVVLNIEVVDVKLRHISSVMPIGGS